MRIFYPAILTLFFLAGCRPAEHTAGRDEVRSDILLNEDWYSVAADSPDLYTGFEQPSFPIENWETVNVPHNWDDYGGYRRLRHGNRHGSAWYRKSFSIENTDAEKRYFLFFEGVGSYATVWVNGDSVGYHAGGRTTFTLDITPFIHQDKENILAVRADHPENIRDLPWVCGGCSLEWGFCEGSQPMGIFRPVHLIETNPVRIEPFGVHIWNDSNILEGSATLHLSSEVKNYGAEAEILKVKNSLLDRKNKEVAVVESSLSIEPGDVEEITQVMENLEDPKLWTLDDPYLYTLVTEIWKEDICIDRTYTPYGIRTIKWDISDEDATNLFYLNGKPVFINGTAEYEHMFGQGHAFHDEQVMARVAQVKAMGYNAFRDGHQPHNLLYNAEWDKTGILWWPQMSAHIWFDTPEFRENFKTLLADWIKERRNSPSVILWGLENESTLPEDFARECTELIRELDPTTSSQRLVTTCNGGYGTDWNVVQNWSGTYGGDPENYANELSEQLLNGEYGAWRSIDLHTEGDFDQQGIYSEDRFNLLMESKIRLGEEAAEQSCGQFHWLLTSHDNPGRTQSGEGLRDIDRVGPVNYKGALTIWGEPLDLFYLYRSNYVSNELEPMVYIVSHTWPDRWIKPGIKNGIRIFSNCDEVELYNGVKDKLLGKKVRGPIGNHFVFDSVDIQENVLYAIGYVKGKAVAEDVVVLNYLPEADNMEKLAGKSEPLLSKERNYIYLVNCGGDEYTDAQGNLWLADVHRTDDNTWGSTSWTDVYEDLPAFYGSQRRTHDPLRGSTEWPLLQTFRYGRHKLKYHFPVPDGQYLLELFFIEPWYGTGGGLDCKDWRVFDVAVNNELVIDDLDIWEEAGHDRLLKKTVSLEVHNGEIEISFPEVKAGQALISAIAISTEDSDIKPSPPSKRIASGTLSGSWSLRSWMDTGEKQYQLEEGDFYYLAPELFGAEWICSPGKISSRDELPSVTLNEKAEVMIGIDTSLNRLPVWLDEWIPLDSYLGSTFRGGTYYRLYKKQFYKGEVLKFQGMGKDDFPMYPVAILPLTSLDDPIDLRNTVTWQAEDGMVRGGAMKVTYRDKDCVFTPGEKGTLGINFQVGLASKYGLHFRYINGSGMDLETEVRIRAADGRLMWSGNWTFLATPDTWRSFRTDTQTTINAGTYTIEITPKSKGPLYIDWLQVQ